MNFDGEYRFIGTVDPQPLREAVEALGEDAWSEYVRRQESYKPHRQTQTIPLLYDEDMRHTDATAWPRLAKLQPVLEPVLQKIRDANAAATGRREEGYFIRIILTRLSPGSHIKPHRDFGPSLLRSHRNHVAITTNEYVDFAIDGKVQHFAPGEIWEINNRKYHAVRNLGEQARVHLILDYVVPGEQVQDSDKGLVYA